VGLQLADFIIHSSDIQIVLCCVSFAVDMFC